MEIELTAAEASHLLTLLSDAEIEGCYYGNRQQYWTRHEAITSKIKDALITGVEQQARDAAGERSPDKGDSK